MVIEEKHTITREDLDQLVKIAETDPDFKKSLQELDVLANKRGIELKDVIETACALYVTKQKAKEWNENRSQQV